MDKKDFAKTITAIRKTLGTAEFPKAMATGQQLANSTCTVNCNDRISRRTGIDSNAIAYAVLTDPRFIAMLDRNTATATVEDNPDGFKQIRVRW